MSIEYSEKTLICPENKLNCTRAEIELLISQLPSSKDCKIKDIETTDEGIMISFADAALVRFDIFWDAKANCCYAFPIETVQSYIQTAKESQEMNLGGDLSTTKRQKVEVVQELTSWYRDQLIAFINETGETPESIEVGFVNGNSLTQIKRQTSELIAQILHNRSKLPKATPLNNPEPQLRAQPENENIVGANILIPAVKLMAGSIGIERLTAELDLTKQTVKKFTEGDVKWLRQTTTNTLTQWFNLNAHKLRELLKNEELINRFLTVSEQTKLKEYLFNQKIIEDDTESEEIDESLLIDDFIAFAALRLVCHSDQKQRIAAEIGISYSTLNEFVKPRRRAIKPKAETRQKVTIWIKNNLAMIGSKFNKNPLGAYSLSKMEQEALKAFL